MAPIFFTVVLNINILHWVQNKFICNGLKKNYLQSLQNKLIYMWLQNKLIYSHSKIKVVIVDLEINLLVWNKLQSDFKINLYTVVPKISCFTLASKINLFTKAPDINLFTVPSPPKKNVFILGRRKMTLYNDFLFNILIKQS